MTVSTVAILVIVATVALFDVVWCDQCCWFADCTGCYDPSTFCGMNQQNCLQCNAHWCPSGPPSPPSPPPPTPPPSPPTPTPPPTPAEKRARDLVNSMSASDKYTLLNGVGWVNWNPAHGMYVGNIPAVTSHNIPSINMQDGPQGFRTYDPSQYGQVTSWPCSLNVAGTWDADLMYQWGAAMGKECRAKGANQLLGPALNFHRVGRGGRNGEYLTGEDPLLGSVMGANYVAGLQSQKVLATVKHYFLNNQETNRDSVNSMVDERTLHEIYLPPFEGAVKAGGASVMCSYNLVNGSHSCENSHILNDVLRSQLGFSGWVMSDWWATHSTSCNQGLDQDQPGTDGFFNPDKLGSQCSGQVDEMAYRILLQMILVGVFDDSVCNTGSGGCDNYLYSTTATNPDHAKLGRTIASNSAALLSNDGVLPLDTLPQGSTIALVGSACNSDYNLQGMEGQWNLGNYYILGGSGRVINPNTVTILQGIQARAQTAGYKVVFDGSNNVGSSVNLLNSSRVGIICGATTSTEGNDRNSLTVDQDSFISQVLAQKPSQTPVVVLLQTPGVVLTNWRQNANAILNMFLAGEQTGNAWADVLFGDVNPSGKLPVTFPVSESDVIAPCSGTTCYYSEGLFVGYRGMAGKSVAFPFGHGLSYTEFTYYWLVKPNTVCDTNHTICLALNITNTGKRNGAEVVQFYIDFPASSGEPPAQLRGFQKVSLPVGVTTNVYFGLTKRDLSIWDSGSRNWVIQSGSFMAYIGSSSRDIRLQSPFTV